jgi:hypothetical protein
VDNNQMKVFEVTAAGFDGGSDDTDDLLYWVAARTEEEVQAAIEDTGACFRGNVGFSAAVDVTRDVDVDFKLPGQSMQFASALLEKASAARNDRRVTA